MIEADQFIERWATDVKRVLFISRLLDETKCRDPGFLESYFVYKIFSDRKNIPRPLCIILNTAVTLCAEIAQSGEESLRSYVEALCSLAVQHRLYLPICDSSNGKDSEDDAAYDLIVAAAYINCVPLLKRLIKNFGCGRRSQLFGEASGAAAMQGNDEALEVILTHDAPSSKNICALYWAITGGNLRTVNLLLEPRWGFYHGGKPVSRQSCERAMFRGLMESSSLDIFRKVYALVRDHDPEPNRPASSIGHLLRCAAERGHTLLLLHLCRLGAPLSGYHTQTWGEENPLWAACNSGNEHSVRLLLRKGVSPDMDADMPMSCPLQVAAARGHLAIVRMLLKFGADVNRASRDGPPAIIYAIKLEHLAIFRLLQQAGADFKSPRVSRLAFDVVAKDGLESMAKLLLQEGAEPTSKSISTALKSGHCDIAEMLREHLTDMTVEVAGFWEFRS